MENHSGDRSLPSSLFFSEFSFFKLFSFSFSFSFLFCLDDDCRETVEKSAYLLLSISSGVNDLL